ncbi:phytanoyl-CoA dioxygenase family protein [Vibrio chagasii]|uniref:phytanoyl-CoA dioxygenase family protein n=1 Tax=Vibrio chagasii TaxID=170679 RepID=UPI0022845B14|nr:phytanoyl-CoA dioxygenase family protein [Vibrio chagasii]MCY9826430.1 phytanoyl-CoA dioxygenase family protein [Vibrio chagasii]
MNKKFRLLDVVVREFIEYLIRFVRRPKVKSNESQSYIKEIESQGYALIPSYFSQEKCKHLRTIIDDLIDSSETNVLRDDLGADSRIYFCESLNESFKEFYSDPFIREMLYMYTGIKEPVGMLLAARILPVAGNMGSGGGWHRDSPVTQQFKAIVYLNDVSTSNGPFQYIKESHLKKKTILAYFKNIFRPKQYRFSESDINAYNKAFSTKITELTGNAGDLIFADTKGLHTGKPIKEGVRYALFCYFWDKSIPEHFEKLKQK